ncbi:MAG: hypothetical protein AAFX52_01735 [Pseudomonadota bacterium]
MKLAVAIALAIVSSWSFALAATVTTFTAQADYEAASGGSSFSLDFDGLSGFQDGDFPGLVDFDTPAASNPDNVNFTGGALTDAGSIISFNNVGSIRGVFAVEVSAFAFDILDVDLGAPTLTILDANNNVLDTFSTPINGFVGVVSDMAIASFTISGASPNALAPDRIFLDNFQAQAVPVPSAAILFLGGAAMFRHWRHRPR